MPVLPGEKVFVFCITPNRPLLIQQAISSHCPQSDCMVFKRFVDFSDRLAIDSPQVIITLPRLISQLPGYTQVMQGTFRGRTTDNYVLVSDNAAITPATIGAQTVIGVIDFLGRAGMKTFISTVFKEGPLTQRVSHIEDLLPLLTYNMAQAVLMFDRDVTYLRQKTKMNLVITPVAVQEEILAVAVRNPAIAQPLIRCLQLLDRDTNSLLGVDSWQ